MRRIDGPEATGQSATEPRPRAPAAIPRLELVVEREGGKESDRRVVLDGDVFRVGSHASNELCLADAQVSRLHCRLRSSSTGWRIEDTGSLNGTRVGGVSVRDADITLPECRIEVGDSVVRVRPLASEDEHRGVAPVALGALYGASPVMRRLFDRITKVARADSDVLIEGESGTGKEMIVAELVRRSARAHKPFVIVDCGAIAQTSIEGELFGHVKGAFAGAERLRLGAFEAAEGGTVFLDEIGELPLEMQPRLLRALAEREVRRIGESKARRFDVRVIATTNRRLEAEINQGRFREDLYFRLGVLRVEVPPLRERVDDLPLLVGAFLETLGVPEKISLFNAEVFERMRQHVWPGNVREVRNYVERFVLYDERGLADEANHAPTLTGPPQPPDVDLSVSFRNAKDRTILDFERAYLTALLAWSAGNVSRAARKAKLDRMYLHRLLQRHGLRRAAPLED